jgi:hypothetical protein
MPHLLKLLLFLPLCNICFAAELLTPHQIASIKHQIGEAFEVFEYGSVGVLSDGETYVAVSFETKDEHKRNAKEWAESQEAISRCAIFKLRPLALLAKSQPFTSYGPRDSVGCKIANGLLLIEHWNSGSLVSLSTETWKFKLVGDRLVLIGYDDVTSEFGDADEDRPYIETQKSLNFLTSQAKLWRKAGNDVEDYSYSVRRNKPFVIKKATKIKEIAVPFVSPPWDFTSFDVEAFQHWIEKNTDLCGYVNDHYVYRPCGQ